MARLSAEEVASRRLAAQGLVRSAASSVAEVVRRMGAIQAQDFLAAKWAIGSRLSGAGVSEGDVDAALAGGAVIRVHAFRGTWQLVARDDVRWMLALVGLETIARTARRLRQLGIDEATFRKTRSILERALRDRRALTRAELAAALSRGQVDAAGQRLPHLLWRAELEALVCNGPPRGSHPTWTLLDEWIPRRGAAWDRPAALTELALRYFTSRGPAALDDFVWWSGLRPQDARAGLESAKSGLIADNFGGRTAWRAPGRATRASSPSVCLVPAFDEYLVAYRHRDAVLSPTHARRLNAGGGMIAPAVLFDGKVAGAWRRTLEPNGRVSVEVELFAAANTKARAAVAGAAEGYAAFLGRALRMSFRTRRRGQRPGVR